jgi:methyl-accepting chemotaxis protein
MQPTKLKLRLGASFLLIVALVAAMGWYAAQRLRGLSASLETVYEDRVVGMQRLRILGEAYALRIQDTVGLMRDGAISSKSAVQRIEDAQRDANLQWSDYKKTYLTPQESRLVALTEPALLNADAAANELKRLMAFGGPSSLNAFASKSLRSSFAPLSSSVERLIALQLGIARLEEPLNLQQFLKNVAGVLARNAAVV